MHYEIWKYCQNTSRVQAQVLENLRVSCASLCGVHTCAFACVAAPVTPHSGPYDLLGLELVALVCCIMSMQQLVSAQQAMQQERRNCVYAHRSGLHQL